MANGSSSSRATARSGEKRPYTIRDQVALRRLGRFDVSPDGRRIVLTIARAASGKNRLDSHCWIMDADGRGLRRLTRGPERESNPIFAPDGSAVYVLRGRRGAKRQVVRVPLDGGALAPVTSSPVDIESFNLSPDGAHVAFSALVYPGGPDTLADTAERLEAERQRPATGHVHDRLFVRHWDEWKTGRRRHLFVQAVAGGDPVDVMHAVDADCPADPMSGREQYAFTPDGRAVVFTIRNAGREEAWSTNLDLFVAPIDGGAEPRCLTPDNPATDTEPSFSPDGRHLAWLAMDRAGYEADKQTVMVRAWPDGAARRLTDGWDRSADALAWSADGRTLYAVANDTGHRPLFAIDVATGSVRSLTTDGRVEHIVVSGDTVFYTLDSLRGPADLYAFDGRRHRRLTRLNASALSKVAIGEAEPFSFAGWNGETVHGWLVKPANFDPAKRYPIAFIVHGGPQSSFGNDWHYRWNPQVYAAAGYATVSIDFHGSTGYGQAFTDSIRGDWGGKPLEDLQLGYAHVLEHYPFLDGSRAAALGASYGGFMVNYIAGVWNEPWRCLVSHDGNLDERFAYYATEELWFPEWEHGGVPWEHPEGYGLHNPVDHVASWRVPMLVIHSAKDYRVTDIEGLAVFTALQRRGVPSRLLYYPDENHWVSKPENSIQWHETVLEWLDRWTA